MAVEIRLLTKNQPKILDLTAGKVRRTVYAERSPALGPLALITIGAVGAALAPGVGRFFFGNSASNEAREKINTDLLLAKLHREDAATAKLVADAEKIRKDFTPLALEEQRLKVRAIEDHIPLDLARLEVKLQSERDAGERAALEFPILMRARESALEIQEELARERSEANAAALELGELIRERTAAETERVRAATEQQEINTRLLETAVDGLDYFSKQVFLRDRLFPPAPAARGAELTLTGRPLRTTTTLTSF